MKEPWALFHVTTLERALSILRDGFRDGEGYYMTDMLLRGVWLSDRPLEENEGVIEGGDTILAVEFGAPWSILDDYELIEVGKPYREWCVPSDLIRQFARIRIVEAEEVPGGGISTGGV